MVSSGQSLKECHMAGVGVGSLNTQGLEKDADGWSLQETLLRGNQSSGDMLARAQGWSTMAVGVSAGTASQCGSLPLLATEG